ncbi:MAG: hypothetical protein AAGE80_17710 [Pseudomonadota bacterium]
MRAWMTALLVMVCTACNSHVPTEGANLSETYLTAGGHWNDGAIVTVMARAVEREGRLAICGAWTARRQSVLTDGLHSRIIEAGLVRVDGERIVTNLRFMQRHSFAEDLRGRPANCIMTERPWQPGAAETIEVRLPRQRFNGGGFGEDGDPVLTFRQGPVPSLLGQEIES